MPETGTYEQFREEYRSLLKEKDPNVLQFNRAMKEKYKTGFKDRATFVKEFRDFKVGDKYAFPEHRSILITGIDDQKAASGPSILGRAKQGIADIGKSFSGPPAAAPQPKPQPPAPRTPAADVLAKQGIAAAPGGALPVPPKALQTPQQLEKSQPWEVDPKTGMRYQRVPFGEHPLDTPITGLRDAIYGYTALSPEGMEASRRAGLPAPTAREMAGSAHQLLSGAMEAGTLLLPEALIQAPAKTAVGVGVGMSAGQGTSKGLEKLGVPKEYSGLIGDIVTILAGGKAAGKTGKGKGKSGAADTTGVPPPEAPGGGGGGPEGKTPSLAPDLAEKSIEQYRKEYKSLQSDQKELAKNIAEKEQAIELLQRQKNSLQYKAEYVKPDLAEPHKTELGTEVKEPKDWAKARQKAERDIIGLDQEIQKTEAQLKHLREVEQPLLNSKLTTNRAGAQKLQDIQAQQAAFTRGQLQKETRIPPSRRLAPPLVEGEPPRIPDNPPIPPGAGNPPSTPPRGGGGGGGTPPAGPAPGGGTPVPPSILPEAQSAFDRFLNAMRRDPKTVPPAKLAQWRKLISNMGHSERERLISRAKTRTDEETAALAAGNVKQVAEGRAPAQPPAARPPENRPVAPPVVQPQAPPTPLLDSIIAENPEVKAAPIATPPAETPKPAEPEVVGAPELKETYAGKPSTPAEPAPEVKPPAPAQPDPDAAMREESEKLAAKSKKVEPEAPKSAPAKPEPTGPPTKAKGKSKPPTKAKGKSKPPTKAKGKSKTTSPPASRKTPLLEAVEADIAQQKAASGKRTMINAYDKSGKLVHQREFNPQTVTSQQLEDFAREAAEKGGVSNLPNRPVKSPTPPKSAEPPKTRAEDQQPVPANESVSGLAEGKKYRVVTENEALKFKVGDEVFLEEETPTSYRFQVIRPGVSKPLYRTVSRDRGAEILKSFNAPGMEPVPYKRPQESLPEPGPRTPPQRLRGPSSGPSGELKEPTKGPVSSAALTSTGKVRLGADVDRLGKILASSLYQGKEAHVVTKELLQNAADAIRGTSGGEVSAHVDPANNTITIEDNGKGMTPQDLATVFTDLGSSGKGEDIAAAGGFGLAKAAPLLMSESLQVETISKVGGGLVKSTMTSTPESLRGEGVLVKTETAPPGSKTGTKIVATMPPDAQGWWEANKFANQFNRSVSLPGKLKIQGSAETESLEKISPIGSFRVGDTADVRIYKSSSKKDLHNTFGSLPVEVNNNGIYQFEDSVYLGDAAKMREVPARIAIDVKSLVDEGHKDYPFTANREALRGDTISRVREYIQKEIIDPAVKEGVDFIAKKYESMPKIQSQDYDIALFDSGSRMTPAETRKFSSHPDIVNLAEDVGQAIDSSLVALSQDKSLPTPLRGLGSGVERVGIVLSDALHGVYIKNPKTGKATVFVNPFSYDENATPTQAASMLWHTIKHELLHDKVSGHGQTFSSGEVKISQALGDGELDSILRLRGAYADPQDKSKFRPGLEELLRIYKESRRRPERERDPFGGEELRSGKSPSGPPGAARPATPIPASREESIRQSPTP